MCGICGVVSFCGEPVLAETLTQTCEALRHRGPDGSGVWIDAAAGGSVGLGATRLAILDPSHAGDQPMHRAGRYHVVHNGEIYNFRELRAELSAAGETFATRSDTEVILAACARWGPEALNRFNGMWALCFYDSQERAGFLARDRFGVKPLLYSADSKRLLFASELSALRGLGPVDDAIDAHAMLHHLHFGYIPHPATIFRAARRLAPGCMLRFDLRGAAAPVCYYDPLAAVRRDGRDGEPSRDRMVRTISEAVGLRRVSDVPIGAFLSGGVDSSIVVHHLAAATPQPVKTFCVGYENHRSFDERRFARLMADQIGAEHHEILITERDALEAIPKVLDHLGEPFGDSSVIPTALVSEFASRHVKVALSGDGGDELFGGYWRYLGHHSLDNYHRMPAAIRRRLVEPVLAAFSSAKAGTLANRVRQFRKLMRTESSGPIARHVAWSRILSPEAERILRDPSAAGALDSAIVQLASDMTAGLAADDPLNRILAFDLRYQLPADMLHKVDIASMMHSLEVRVPMLDFRVVESALSLPSSCKVDRGLRKRILTDAYRGLLPDEILDRPKQGFETPIGEYLRGPLQTMFRDVVRRDAVESFDMLCFDGVQRAYNEHLERRADHTDVLFALLSLCWWQARKAVRRSEPRPPGRGASAQHPSH